MINKQPSLVFIYDRYKKASSTKKATIELRITYNYKQRHLSTGISVYPNQWKNGRIVHTPDALQLNQTLDEILVNVRQDILRMSKEGKIDVSEIQLRKQEPLSFIDFCRQRAAIRKYGKTSDTQERYNRFLRLFSEWGLIRAFEDVTDNNIILYDEFLRKQGMKAYSKWNNYHRFLNSFILDAIDEGHLSRNPYRWLNIEKGKSEGGINKYLSPSEFRILRKAIMPSASLERIRDLFIFQTYTCLSFSDLKEFDSSLIHTVKGAKVYTGTRKKTGKSFIIPMFPEALKILHKYNDKLPIISNVKYNEYLKIVAMAAKIDKPLSSHWARHTGATLLLNKGINMNIVSKVCGHSSIRITEQIYAKMLDETIVEEVMKIKDPSN